MCAGMCLGFARFGRCTLCLHAHVLDALCCLLPQAGFSQCCPLLPSYCAATSWKVVLHNSLGTAAACRTTLQLLADNSPHVTKQVALCLGLLCAAKSCCCLLLNHLVVVVNGRTIKHVCSSSYLHCFLSIWTGKAAGPINMLCGGNWLLLASLACTSVRHLSHYITPHTDLQLVVGLAFCTFDPWRSSPNRHPAGCALFTQRRRKPAACCHMLLPSPSVPFVESSLGLHSWGAPCHRCLPTKLSRALPAAVAASVSVGAAGCFLSQLKHKPCRALHVYHASLCTLWAVLVCFVV